jgi:hypothetical protein
MIKISHRCYLHHSEALLGGPTLFYKTEMKMQTTINQTIHTSYNDITVKSSLWSRFIAYCAAQEHNRLLWVGLILAVHGCALTPITVMATLFTGPNFFLFMAAMVAMGIALVTNLAAMPTKATIPAFALSVLIDIAILVACVVIFLS